MKISIKAFEGRLKLYGPTRWPLDDTRGELVTAEGCCVAAITFLTRIPFKNHQVRKCKETCLIKVPFGPGSPISPAIRVLIRLLD